MAAPVIELAATMTATHFGYQSVDEADKARHVRGVFDSVAPRYDVMNDLMSLGLHLRIIGRPGRIGALRKFMAYVKQQPDVWVATRGQIADHFARVSPFQT